MNDVLNAIMTVGFPTVACIAIAGYMVKINSQNRVDNKENFEKIHDILEKSTECISNNTNALYELKEIIKRGDKNE